MTSYRETRRPAPLLKRLTADMLRNVATYWFVYLLVMGASGCDTNDAPVTGPGLTTATLEAPEAVAKADGLRRSDMPADFPQEQDLAILVPMDAEPPIRGNHITNDGDVLLSEDWLMQVSDSYADTDVEDAFETENFYEDWRVVSVRVAPCGPLGHFPGHVSDGACWPQVRIVWEPVLEDHMLFGFTLVERFADDRAIHASYRVNPDPNAVENSPAMEAVISQIEGGRTLDELDNDTLERFVRDRNRAMMRLTADVAALRDPSARVANFGVLDTREEYNLDDTAPFEFQDRLGAFLSRYAQPWALHELTSFSLPEGRSPAMIDSWVFVAFEGHQGRITQKDITVRSKRDGRVLVNIGLSQRVDGGAGEDEVTVQALEDPSVAQELREQVFFEQADVEAFGDVIADPTQTFVANTTCATCHRLTDITFDFHTFSYFEEREATISPRVIEDVANDLRILRAFLETWPR